MATASLNAVLRRLHRAVPAPDDPRDDRQLLDAFAVGHDDAAFAVLVRQHGSMVLNVCSRVLHHEHDAEDAFQAAFLVLAARAPSLRLKTTLAGFQHGIAYHLALKARRESIRRRRREARARVPAETDAAAELSWREVQTAVTQKTVRAGLVEAVVEGARLGAAGTLAGAVPARVAMLTRAGLQTLTGKMKLALIGLAALLMAGTGGAIFQVLTANPDAAGPVVQAPPPKQEEAEQARTDAVGDLLPPGAMVRLGTVRFRHGFGIQSVAFSPDGKKVAAGGNGLTISLWDAATGKEVRSFRKVLYSTHVAFSPDGKVLASAHWRDSVVVLWDASTGEVLRTLRGQEQVFCLAFSPDGKLLASGGLQGTVCLWDPATGKELRRLDGQEGGRLAVAFTPDSKSLAFADKDGKILFLDVRTGALSRRLKEGHATGAGALSFSPDGKLLASVGADGKIRLWATATGEPVRVIDEKLERVTRVAFSPDGRTLASAQADGTLALLDPATGRIIRRWSAHACLAETVTFSPNGKVLASAGRWESDVRLWDPATGTELHASTAPHGPAEILRWSPDGQTLLSAGREPRMLWWDLATGRPRRSLTLPAPTFDILALAPDGKTLAEGSRDMILRLWDVPSGRPAHVLGKQQVSRQTIAFSPDGRLLATEGPPGETRLWDVASGKELRRFGDLGHRVDYLTFSPDGRTLAFGIVPFGNPTDNPWIRLVDVASGKEVRSFSGLGSVRSLVYSPDGKVLASWQEWLIRLWDVASGKEVCHHASQSRVGGVIAFSPDGKLVASAGGPYGTNDCSLHLWEAATGRILRRFEGHYSGVASFAFSPDGLKLASGGSDATILVWDITGRRMDGLWHAQPLTPRQLDSCWTALANEDAARAYDAVWKLAAAPEQAVPFLAQHLPPRPRPDAQRVARLLADLDSGDFNVRQKASEELGKLGEAVAPTLRKALANGPALEARRRMQELLDRVQTPDWTPERLRDRRAIQVLEYLGTGQAQEVLQAIAGGAAGTLRTEEARAALQRVRESQSSGDRGDAK
jgi:WD40 repeat protein